VLTSFGFIPAATISDTQLCLRSWTRSPSSPAFLTAGFPHRGLEGAPVKRAAGRGGEHERIRARRQVRGKVLLKLAMMLRATGIVGRIRSEPQPKYHLDSGGRCRRPCRARVQSAQSPQQLSNPGLCEGAVVPPGVKTLGKMILVQRLGCQGD
jgi:hypothetical protein